MNQYFVLVLLLFLCLFFQNVSTAQQPDEFETVIRELASTLPSGRVIRTSRYVDSLRESKVSIAGVGYRLEKLSQKATLWNDQLLSSHVRFYQITKRGFQSALTPNDIIAEFDSARTYFEKSDDQRYTAVCHYYIGCQRYDQKQYGEAFYHHAKALELFEAVGFDKIPEMGKYLHVMAINNLYFHNYSKVVQLMRIAISLPPYNENLDVQRYNTLAIAYQNLNQLDSTIYFFKRTREIAISIGNTTWPYIAIGNLGKVYLKQGRYREALNMMMQEYLNNQSKSRHRTMARNTAIGIASIWQKFGQQDSVLRYLKISEQLNASVGNGEPMWKHQRDKHFYLNYYRVFHDYHKTRGNMAMAYNYLDSLTRLSNETNLIYNKTETKLAEDRLKIQQQLADISEQKADKERIRTRLQFIIGMVGLLAVILSLLYYLLRLKHSKDRLIAEKERKIQLALQEKTETKLIQANVELGEYMQHLKEKSDLVESFRSQIDELRKLPDPENQQLDDLMNQLANIKLLTPDDWNDFRKRFNQAFTGELDQLKLNYGDLTVAEERLYALEKMNVSTSQIAWMLGISKESVRKARYRLRKKMHL
ncbi:tetratricopeptide repeat protein [Dyadobacter aurulentus]|uniref:tetratricopeptide repeat protein n=1 Tax=Dyadobacter sp. UC 10 TaxID=2605428 RepID=UPI0011F1CD20|nr:tetratricopeptide repeat protein [Dyadobacter sp. UC 10]KAA0990916.1 tetratricopeptide repeat protein [Dyadobacter sp. UC 10]